MKKHLESKKSNLGLRAKLQRLGAFWLALSVLINTCGTTALTSYAEGAETQVLEEEALSSDISSDETVETEDTDNIADADAADVSANEEVPDASEDVTDPGAETVSADPAGSDIQTEEEQGTDAVATETAEAESAAQQ